MFTGLITEMGSLVAIRPNDKGAVLSVKAPLAAKEAEVGDSIAINGTCLTVTEIRGGALSFDASAQTMKATTLGLLRPGSPVNIEPSLRANGKLGGHMVSGHVDAVGTIKSRTDGADAILFEIESPSEVLRHLVKKGSVTVDGISLTVVDVRESSFTLVIIPHTAKVTTLGQKGRGDKVNLESDIIGKYVYHYLSRGSGGGNDSESAPSSGGIMDALSKGGFM